MPKIQNNMLSFQFLVSYMKSCYMKVVREHISNQVKMGDPNEISAHDVEPDQVLRAFSFI